MSELISLSFNPEIVSNQMLSAVSLDSPEKLAQAEKAFFERVGHEAINRSGQFVVTLCGGRAPKPLFQLLRDSELDWSKVHLFWGDERPPRPDTGQTNFEAASEGLLQYIDIPAENVHQIDVKSPNHQQVAESYIEEIKFVLGPKPQFDLMVIGGGGQGQMDGHMMGIMRNSEIFDRPNLNLVEVVSREDTGFGYTMTPKVLASARQVLVLLPGQEKLADVRKLIETVEGGANYPIGLLNSLAAGKVVVMTDQPIT